ncbi:acyl-CoA dehydrogenase family protein [Pseudooceanicola batsensis HTCC2597]|uniref:3-methylmercaptopropionyl-CoA dehydrogenase n=1 Tax=Pseudooceanicola batsensis (strain ATCC BAA-863 / DSM 15984 / KCTC 12145 / HTCC2597) TaxID=252305 RepID=A3TV96_PSEBH|nr:acyl-CoA dehydrogenase [Pseudooceanicola batsensis]EAQ04442.1 acyl-CoA dehydrogenase family protein [Pseudooceanicola batsensis HTCC2597]
MPYRSPVSEYKFVLDHVVGFGDVAATETYAEATPDTVDAILSEVGKLADEVFAPLNRSGDIDPARLENGVVRTSKGFADGYAALVEGGWLGLAAPAEHGGMGLPQTLNCAVNDFLSASCLSLGLNPLLTQGQIEALQHHAPDWMKELYLPRLISGEWTGTMNLTEPQAGSDVGALTTRAVAQDDGTYAVTGQKIYISWGDHDFGGNVCHLVLARLPEAPAGTRGISLFMVPKYIPDADGNLGDPNSLRVVSLEHKMGLHGSPTCVMQFDGATGWLVGEENKGMAAMFTMMNNARLGVGMQGIGIAEGALQHAIVYALERKQGRTPLEGAEGGTGTILDHADVRRMIATMRADTFAARSIALACGVAIDMAAATGDAAWKARAAFLTPIAKGFGTDTGMRVSEMGVQVHGGMGYVEETGAAQYSRDVRVTAIYEGTNGIQAMDMVARKMMDGGDAANALIDEISATAEKARADLPELGESLWEAAETLREATEWMVSRGELNERFAGAVPYLTGFARVLGAHFHLRAALAEGGDGPRTRLARFYVNRLLPEHVGHLAHATCGAGDLYALTTEELTA